MEITWIMFSSSRDNHLVPRELLIVIIVAVQKQKKNKKTRLRVIVYSDCSQRFNLYSMMIIKIINERREKKNTTG